MPVEQWVWMMDWCKSRYMSPGERAFWEMARKAWSDAPRGKVK